MTKLTENFSLEEMIASQTAANRGIDNTPDQWQIENMQRLCENLLQPLRDAIGVINVSSGFRSPALNRAIGGSRTSQHCKGEAADIKCNNNAALFHLIRETMDFDQLIWEFGDNNQPQWIHVSYKKKGNRNQVLIAFRENEKTAYRAYAA